MAEENVNQNVPQEVPEKPQVKKKGAMKHLLGAFTSRSRSDSPEKVTISGKEYYKDDEAGEFVSVENSNEKIPYYVFGQNRNNSKLKHIL